MSTIWQLDGARGFHSLTRTQRAILLGLSTVLWLISSTGMLFLIALGAAYRLFKKDKNTNEQPDNIGFMQFAGLLAALTTVIALTPVR